MVRHQPSLRGTAAAIVVLAVLLLLAAGQQPAYTDDIDLLRFTTAKPYVYFIVDNSASMALSPAGQWVHANGDDPRSKLYQVKRIVYDVLKDINDIQFGFAAFNQDTARVAAKHWLYYYTETASNTLPAGWPINYPAADNDGPIITAADGTVTSDIEGDLMTFGAHLDATGILGTCPAPLAFGAVGADDREKINRFAKLGALGSSITQMWIKGGTGNKTYRLTVVRPGKKADDVTPNPALGTDNMDIKLTLEEVRSNGCTGDQTANFQQTQTTRLELTLWTDFLMFDEDQGRSAPNGNKAGGVDYAAGFWDAQDVLADATCGSGHPFSGKGWKETTIRTGPLLRPPLRSTRFVGNASDPDTCYNLKRPTIADLVYGRPLDKGDMLPFDWRSEQKTELLQRFAPNYPSGSPDFRIASYFKNSPGAETGVLELRADNEIPLFASGPSPMGKSVIDFRCWYQGEGNKCDDDAYGAGGWESVAAAKDSEWGCRRPYLIVLSDGGDTCAGENPCADTADLNSKSGVKTWVIAYGANCNAVGNPLKCMAQNGKGELLCPTTATQLKSELERILGLIRQEARSFASAAVPSVQALVDDKIFLTNFTPLNGEAVWDGHVHSFFKPIPPTADGRPDTSAAAACPRPPVGCPTCPPEYANCHAWDAGKVMTTTQVNVADPTGDDANQRRVYYAQQSTSTTVPFTRELFEATVDTTSNTIRYDLWRGLGISFTEGDTSSESSAQTNANTVIANTFAVKSATIDVKNPDGTITPTTIQYVLGDVFHSNPLVVGSPPNVQYFALDLNGYQDFADRHRLRRKLLVVGANDGMLHAFDAGIYNRDSVNFPNKFDKGTGAEVFAFIPRSVLPTVKLLSDPSTTNHQWSVDGTMTVADAFIDPKNGGGFGPPNDDQREWRTVAIGGLREGGSLYYALDITQPDRIGADGEPDWIKGYVPSCLDTPNPATLTDGGSDANCGPVPFPSVLWEFDDSVVESGNRIQLDEEDTGFPSGDGDPDGNLKPDIGETWSIPNLGRIRIATAPASTVTRDVYVAVFSGGLDPNNPTTPQMGTWIYMVDVETGKAIYKRQLEGSVPSEPAAVDTNNDGYLDRIYVGTMAGLLYRIDLKADLNDPADPTDDVFPALEAQLVTGLDGALHTVQRIPRAVWEPRAIFDASTELGVPTLVDRPIFFRPSVVYDAKLGVYLIAFGTGYRDELWNNDGQTGRFFVFLDDTDNLDPATLPLKENVFQRVLADDLALGGNLEDRDAGAEGLVSRPGRQRTGDQRPVCAFGCHLLLDLQAAGRGHGDQGRTAVLQDRLQPDLHRQHLERGSLRATADRRYNAANPALRSAQLRHQSVHRAAADEEQDGWGRQ